MSKKGIKVMQTIENEGAATSRVALKKTVQYTDVDKAWKNQIWEKHRYVFDNEKYNDTRWRTPSEYGDRHVLINWDDLDKWQDSLKIYMLLLLDKNLNPFSTAVRIKNLVNFIKSTDYFSEDCFVNFDDDPYRYCLSADTRADLLIFFEFIDIQPRKYIERLNELKFEDKIRDIPAFNSIYKFDKLIDNFKSEVNMNDAFIVIVLWWELTKVIPIRPIEFFTLRKNSFFIDNNRCYINVKRAKLKNKQYEIPLLDKIGISKEIYDLFAQYIEANEKYLPNPDSFLFNVDIFQNCARALFIYRTGYIGSQQMYTLFRDFLDVIVVKQYGYTIVEKGNNEELGDNEIEYFQFGDSRHIAFLNLLLSGFSPYTIAQIGGHTTIRQQMHYYDHLETYLASKAYTMATEARMSLKVSAGAFDIREKYAISKAVTSANNNELQLMRKIEFGWCVSENFPYECEFDDCLNCPNSIIDEEHQQIIPEKLKQYKDDIHKHVDFLKRVLSNPSLGSDSDRMTAINAINSDVATMAALQNKRHTEV